MALRLGDRYSAIKVQIVTLTTAFGRSQGYLEGLLPTYSVEKLAGKCGSD